MRPVVKSVAALGVKTSQSESRTKSKLKKVLDATASKAGAEKSTANAFKEEKNVMNLATAEAV